MPGVKLHFRYVGYQSLSKRARLCARPRPVPLPRLGRIIKRVTADYDIAPIFNVKDAAHETSDDPSRAATTLRNRTSCTLTRMP